MEEKEIYKEREKTDNLFHRLWTKAVGTKDYDKKEWQELERRIWKNVEVEEKL